MDFAEWQRKQLFNGWLTNGAQINSSNTNDSYVDYIENVYSSFPSEIYASCDNESNYVTITYNGFADYNTSDSSIFGAITLWNSSLVQIRYPMFSWLGFMPTARSENGGKFYGWVRDSEFSNDLNSNINKIYNYYNNVAFGSGVSEITFLPVFGRSNGCESSVPKPSWLQTAWTITFNTNGGSSVSSTTYTKSSSSQTQSLSTPTKSGYTFSGWTVSWTDTLGHGTTLPTISGTTLTIPTNCFGNITLKASWTKDSSVSYTITFNTNGGYSMASKTYEQSSSSQKIYLTVPIYNGYTFAGWTISWTNSTHSSTLPTYSDNYLTIPANCYGNITMKASWTKNTGGSSFGYVVIEDEDGLKMFVDEFILYIGNNSLSGAQTFSFVSTDGDVDMSQYYTNESYVGQFSCDGCYGSIYLVSWTDSVRSSYSNNIVFKADKIEFQFGSDVVCSLFVNFPNLAVIDISGVEFNNNGSVCFEINDTVTDVIVGPGSGTWSFSCDDPSIEINLWDSDFNMMETINPDGSAIAVASSGIEDVVNTMWNESIIGENQTILSFKNLLSQEKTSNDLNHKEIYNSSVSETTNNAKSKNSLNDTPEVILEDDKKKFEIKEDNEEDER